MPLHKGMCVVHYQIQRRHHSYWLFLFCLFHPKVGEITWYYTSGQVTFVGLLFRVLSRQQGKKKKTIQPKPPCIPQDLDLSTFLDLGDQKVCC